ncbi:MAG TPA: peptidoglycan DD-metalloendopeptidase family protein [Deferrimonas sp.]
MRGNGYRPWRPFWSGILLLFAVVLPAQGEDLTQSRKGLRELDQQIRQTTRNLEKKRSAERSLVDELKIVDDELEGTRRRVGQISGHLKLLDEQVRTGEEHLREVQRSAEAAERRVRRRLVSLYKGGEVGLLRVLFSSATPAEMAEDYDYLGRIVRRDRLLLDDYRRQQAALETAQRQLAELRQDQQAALDARRADQENLRQALQLKATLLSEVRRDKKVLARTLDDLKERAERLTALVKNLETGQAREYSGKPGVFPGQKGKLPWPAQGRVKVGFGTWRHPDLGTLYDSKGLEIAVSGEKPVNAVWQGEVVFASWFKGYGNLLIVDHGDSYFTLYAQAARLSKKVGDRVAEGEPLGFTAPEGAVLYFEIRQGGTPVDPAKWLRPL